MLKMFILLQLAIRVVPHTVPVGGSIRMTCTVPRAAENRGLIMQVEGHRSHYIQLEGDRAAVTHTFVFQEMPCLGESLRAMCLVQPNSRRAMTSIVVTGCGQ